MEWTTERPKKPGWYWYRGSVFKSRIFWEMYEVDVDGYRIYTDENGCTKYTIINELDGEWAGPIPEPTERKEG